MEVLTALFNTVLVVFVVATMLSAGLRTSISALLEVLRNGVFVVLVLVANLVAVPLLGLVVGLLFALSTAGVIALILVASSPGAPFGAKMAMIQKGDVVTGSVLQVVLAAVGSVTFPITANLLIGWAALGDDINIPVGRLIASVAVLQLVPFTVGLTVRAWAPVTAARWIPVARASNLAFLGVLAFGVLGSWNQIVDLIGSRVLLAAVVFTVVGILAGWGLATGGSTTRTTAALIGADPKCRTGVRRRRHRVRQRPRDPRRSHRHPARGARRRTTGRVLARAGAPGKTNMRVNGRWPIRGTRRAGGSRKPAAAAPATAPTGRGNSSAGTAIGRHRPR